MDIHELSPIYSSQKSFYGKAWVLYDDGFIYLKSYNTIVSVIDLKTSKAAHRGFYSNTTSRHQKEFRHQFSYYEWE